MKKRPLHVKWQTGDECFSSKGDASEASEGGNVCQNKCGETKADSVLCATERGSHARALAAWDLLSLDAKVELHGDLKVKMSKGGENMCKLSSYKPLLVWKINKAEDLAEEWVSRCMIIRTAKCSKPRLQLWSMGEMFPSLRPVYTP